MLLAVADRRAAYRDDVARLELRRLGLDHLADDGALHDLAQLERRHCPQALPSEAETRMSQGSLHAPQRRAGSGVLYDGRSSIQPRWRAQRFPAAAAVAVSGRHRIPVTQRLGTHNGRVERQEERLHEDLAIPNGRQRRRAALKDLRRVRQALRPPFAVRARRCTG